jgi:hypothetical protein
MFSAMSLDKYKYALKFVDIDSENGIITWKERRGGKPSGSQFGSPHYAGRIATLMRVGGKRVYISAHRLIYMHHYGHLPKSLDHIDGDPLNNKISNLRAATHQQNMCNKKLSNRNKSGCHGVRLMPSGKWEARITHKGDRIYLGLFEMKKDAIDARKRAEAEYFGQWRRK